MIIGTEAIDGLEDSIGSVWGDIKAGVKKVGGDAYQIGKGAAAARLGTSLAPSGGGGGGGGGGAMYAPPPPPKKGLSTGAKVAIGVGGLALIFGAVKLSRGRR